VVVQEDELKFVDNPAPFDGLYRKELLQGLNFEVIKGDRTLFDGVHLMFVPGHSAGGQAVCLQTRKGKAVISGLCGTRENFYPLTANPFAGGGEIVLPGIMLDAVKAYQSMVKIKGIADLIVPLHDPEVMEMQSIP
jgi:N-acyl homoserine lactone hydrolase